MKLFCIIFLMLISFIASADKFLLDMKYCNNNESCISKHAEKTYITGTIQDKESLVYNTAQLACSAYADSIRNPNSIFSTFRYKKERSRGGSSSLSMRFTEGDYSWNIVSSGLNKFRCVVSFDQTRDQICKNSDQDVSNKTYQINSPSNRTLFQSNQTAIVYGLLKLRSGSASDINFYDDVRKKWIEYNSEVHYAHYNIYSAAKAGCDQSELKLFPVSGVSSVFTGYLPLSTQFSTYITRIPDQCGEEEYYSEDRGECVCDDGLTRDPIVGCDYKRTCPTGYELNALTGFCAKTSSYCSYDANKNKPECIHIGEKQPDSPSAPDKVKPSNTPNVSVAKGSLCSTSLSCYAECTKVTGFCDVTEHGILNDGSYYRWFNPFNEEWKDARNLTAICRNIDHMTPADVDWKPLPDPGELSKVLIDKESKIWCYFTKVKENSDSNDNNSPDEVVQEKTGIYETPPIIVSHVYDQNDQLKDRSSWNEQLVIGDEDGLVKDTDSGSDDGDSSSQCSNEDADCLARDSFFNTPDFSTTTQAFVTDLRSIPAVAHLQDLTTKQFQSNSCPTYSFSVLNMDFTFDSHCMWLERFKTAISVFFKALWTFAALVIFMRRT